MGSGLPVKGEVVLAHLAQGQEGQAGDIFGPGQTASLHSKATASAGPSQGKHSQGICFDMHLDVAENPSAVVGVGPLPPLPVMGMSLQQTGAVIIKVVTKQIQQKSQSIFALSSSHLPNARGNPLLVPEVPRSWVGDQHQPHQMAERGQVAHLGSSWGSEHSRKKH